MLTLKELKKVVKVAGMTKRVPSEKALEKEEIVVKEILSGECDITVYANGYVLYRKWSGSNPGTTDHYGHPDRTAKLGGDGKCQDG